MMDVSPASAAVRPSASLRRAIAKAALIVLALSSAGAVLSLAPATAAAAQRWRLMSIPLDMPMTQDLDGEFLDGIYEEKLHPQLVDSVEIDWPSPSIVSHFKGDRTLELLFSSAASGQRIFSIRLQQPLTRVSHAMALQNIQAQFGKPDADFRQSYQVTGKNILQEIVIFIDPILPATQQETIRRKLAGLQLDATQLSEFWAMSLRQRADLLGLDFRGAIVILRSENGQALSLQSELVDLRLAQTVYNLVQ